MRVIIGSKARISRFWKSWEMWFNKLKTAKKKTSQKCFWSGRNICHKYMDQQGSTLWRRTSIAAVSFFSICSIRLFLIILIILILWSTGYTLVNLNLQLLKVIFCQWNKGWIYYLICLSVSSRLYESYANCIQVNLYALAQDWLLD